MRAAAVVGFKKSGKTTLVAQIAEALERKGLRVGVIKFSHHNLDKQHTDTFWLMRSGRTVAGCGPEEAALFWSHPVQAEALACLMPVDIILAEGGKSSLAWPRITCLKEAADLPLLLAPPEGSLATMPVLATVGAAPVSDTAPHFADPTAEAADELAELILAQGKELCPPAGLSAWLGTVFAPPKTEGGALPASPCSCLAPQGASPCPSSIQKEGIQVCIGGKALAMHSVAEHTLASAITKACAGLNGYEPGKEIIITLPAKG